MPTDAIEPANPLRRRVIVHGRVQGVYFRGATEAEAVALGVAGWVRNRGDGSVEAVFEGDPEAVAGIVAFCRRGPRHARVARIEVLDEEPEGLRGFRTLPTQR
jgi:acylphosphatase